MDSRNKKGLIVTLVFAVIAFVAYKVITGGKESYAKTIIKWNGTTGSLVNLMEMDEGFLKAWAKALENGDPVFVFNNKQYSTNGGKAVQN